MYKLFITLLLAVILSAKYSSAQTPGAKKNKVKHAMSSPSVSVGALPPLDTAVIERIIGIRGKSSNGEYKITIPQNDLRIMVDSFKIIPAMGLGTWVAFTPAPGGGHDNG